MLRKRSVRWCSLNLSAYSTMLTMAMAMVVLLVSGQPAMAKKSVKVGFIAPLSGGVSANGLGAATPPSWPSA